MKVKGTYSATVSKPNSWKAWSTFTKLIFLHETQSAFNETFIDGYPACNTICLRTADCRPANRDSHPNGCSTDTRSHIHINTCYCNSISITDTANHSPYHTGCYSSGKME